jgi:alkylation response protein AidB-like acyl-CoA dehydrogenase
MAEAPRTVLLLDLGIQQAWHKVLARKGWIVPSWPVEYGGTGWTIRQRHIFAEELGRAKAPALSPFLNMIGPVLYTFGTEAQKARHLPPLRSGDTLWCQGYSEPGAGSDLASLQTRAVRDGDAYVVNGQKIWTTAAREAQWIFCLVRTSTEGKPQAGISFLLIDLASPGISIRPITSIDGQRHLNEVFFTDVRVPLENRIGEENRGWEYAKFLLQHERNSIGETGTLRIALGNLRTLAAAAPGESAGRSLLESPLFARSLAEVEIDLIALECLTQRSLSRQERGDERDSDASIVKLRQSEIQQRISELAIDSLGEYVAADQTHAFVTGSLEGVAGPPGGPQAVTSYLFNRAVTILGGTSEVQRGIIYKTLPEIG